MEFKLFWHMQREFPRLPIGSYQVKLVKRTSPAAAAVPAPPPASQKYASIQVNQWKMFAVDAIAISLSHCCPYVYCLPFPVLCSFDSLLLASSLLDQIRLQYDAPNKYRSITLELSGGTLSIHRYPANFRICK